MEYNLVEAWLRKDPIRWIAGVLAGLLAGAAAIGIAMGIASVGGYEAWFPVKLMATPILGPEATEIGDQSRGILFGVGVIELICVFWGFIYAHFVSSNKWSILLAMGLVWATFSWIFTWNLYLQSFNTIYAAHMPSGPLFLICLGYGIVLSSVKVFDRILRGSHSH